LYAVIKSYLLYRTFRVKYGEVAIQLKELNSWVPQGSVLGTVLYLLYTADFLVGLSFTTATANDTAILMAHNQYGSTI